MKKHLIISGIVFVLLMVVLGGCNDLQSDNQSEIDIIGKIDGENLILEHRGGELLEFDNIDIILTIGNNTSNLSSNDFEMFNDDEDGYWGIGEIMSIHNENITTPNIRIDITIIDLVTNRIIYDG